MKSPTMGVVIAAALAALAVRAEGPTHEQGIQWTGLGLDDRGSLPRARPATTAPGAIQAETEFWHDPAWTVPVWRVKSWPPRRGSVLEMGTPVDPSAPGVALTIKRRCRPIPPKPTARIPQQMTIRQAQPPPDGSVRAVMCEAVAAMTGDPKARVEKSPTICGKPAGNERFPVIVVAGYWETFTKFVPDDSKVTAACAGPLRRHGKMSQEEFETQWGDPSVGALAKCVRLWHMLASGDQLTACIHMARAAYFPHLTPASFTRPHTQVDAYDVRMPSKGHHHRGCTTAGRVKYGPGEWNKVGVKSCLCSMSIEAEWDQDGAVCLHHLRYDDLLKMAEENQGLSDSKAKRLADRLLGGERSIRTLKRIGSLRCRDPESSANRSRNGYARQALLANRSVAMIDETHPHAFPEGDRVDWDDTSCLEYCSDATDRRPAKCNIWEAELAVQ